MSDSFFRSLYEKYCISVWSSFPHPEMSRPFLGCVIPSYPIDLYSWPFSSNDTLGVYLSAQHPYIKMNDQKSKDVLCFIRLYPQNLYWDSAQLNSINIFFIEFINLESKWGQSPAQTVSKVIFYCDGSSLTGISRRWFKLFGSTWMHFMRENIRHSGAPEICEVLNIKIFLK